MKTWKTLLFCFVIGFSVANQLPAQAAEGNMTVVPGPSFTINPNPVTGNIFSLEFNFKSSDYPNARVNITNVLGQTVYTHNLTSTDYSAGTLKINISEAKLSKGIYLVQVKSGEANKTLRLVIR